MKKKRDKISNIKKKKKSGLAEKNNAFCKERVCTDT